MSSLGIGIFVLTYVLISARRLSLLGLDRPSGALLGAVLCVALGTLTEDQAIAAVHGPTLLLLLGVMGMGAFLDLDGFFEQLEHLLVHGARSPSILLGKLVWGAGLLSALITNDAVCVLGAPLVVRLVKHQRLPPLPYLLALCTAANTGSVATLVGNPQNMLIGTMSGMPFTTFLSISAPATLAAMLVNSLLLWLMYRRVWRDEATRAAERAPEAAQEALATDATRTLIITLAVVGAFFAGAHLGYAALAGAAALMILDRREPHEVFAKVEWTLLLFFSALFIVVAGLEHTGLIAQAWQALAPKFQLDQGAGVLWFSAALVVGSNLISNVPMVLMTGPHLDALGSSTRGWALLAFVSTIAGNLTLVGSVANLIVAERARERYDLGFWEYLRFGVISTLGALLVGVPLILWMT